MIYPKNQTVVLVVIILSFFLFAPVPPVFAGQDSPTILENDIQHAPDRILFRLKGNAKEEMSSGGLSAMSGGNFAERLGMPSGVRIVPGGGRRGGEEFSPMATEEEMFVAPYHVLWLDGLITVEDCLTRLADHPLVEYAEPDGAGEGGSVTPSDPSYLHQWHHAKIQMPEVWRETQGSEGIVVAVLDTGLNVSLSEFQGRVVPGYDFVHNSPAMFDDHGHGTAVAGVIAANANNGYLGAGVDWNCRIMPLKVLDQHNSGYYSWWADGIYFAVANGARVINLSAGGATDNTTLRNAVRYAVQEGVVFVSITHNHGTGTITFPGRMPEGITVGATERNDGLASFSNWGSAIDLVAPGRDIYTVTRNGTLSGWWGTSFAAPQVSAVAVLLLSVRPDLDHEGVRQLLRAGADDQVGDSRDIPGFDRYYGAGRLNAFHSLTLATTAIHAVEQIPDGAVRLRWPVPSNAVSKQPFAIEYSDDLRVWHAAPFPAYSLSTTSGEWLDQGAADRPHPAAVTQRFYRIVIRE